MPNNFEILAQFLDRTEFEVEGRALEISPPPPPLLEQLRALARGQLPTDRQGAIFEQLRQNRQWIPLLADEVKALRVSPDAKS